MSDLTASAATDVSGTPARCILRRDGIDYHFPAPRERSAVLARLFDLVVGGLLATLAAPIVVVVSIAIKLSSAGPVLFRQQRACCRTRDLQDATEIVEVRPFACLKFRTMLVESDDTVHATHIHAFINGSALRSRSGGFKLEGDDRVTRVGRLLRRTSLDELPQLVNVVRGEMSLVGPRPVPLYEVERYPATALERLLVKPGMTGLWQVEARGNASFEEMVRLDVDYIGRRSLLLDFWLLARTFPAVLSGKGAA